MGVRSRAMRPGDVREAAKIIAADPVVGPRYGTAITDLGPVWLQVLGSEAIRAVVIEDSTEGNVEIVGVGISVFVSDGFLHEVKTPPFFWAGPEITKRVMRGTSPLLTDKQVRRANSNGGLNVMVWEGVVQGGNQCRPEAHHCMLSSFVEQHRGFLLKKLLGHGTSMVGLEATFRMGNMFF